MSYISLYSIANYNYFFWPLEGVFELKTNPKVAKKVEMTRKT